MFSLFSATLNAQKDEFSAEQLEILNLINRHRQSIGKNSLQMDAFLCTIAMTHSEKMAKRRIRFGHSGFKRRIRKTKNQYENSYRYAENVAAGQKTPKQVVDAWLKSPGHRKNIEGDYNFCGLAVARNKRGVPYYTHFFMMKK